MRTIDCQTDITWMHKDKPQTVNYSNLLSRTKNTGIQSETLSNDIHLSSTTENQKVNKNNRKASSSQSKDETSKARQIKDVELKESEHHSHLKAELGQLLLFFLIGNVIIQWNCCGVRANFTEVQFNCSY